MSSVSTLHLRLALAFVVLATLVTPWHRELYVGDETKYTQVVREMRDGPVFVPTLEGVPFTHKPPVHFWLVLAFTQAFGLYSVWSFVLPSLLAFVVLLWVLHRAGGPIAAFVAATSLMVWASAQTARMDVLFTLLLALGALQLQRRFEGTEKRGLVVAAVAFGVATLVKGPMALVIAFLLWLFESMRTRTRPRWRDAGALLVMLAIPLAWLVSVTLVAGPGFLREIVFTQLLGRAVGSWVHREPLWFYLPRLPLELCPWILLLVLAILAARRREDRGARFFESWLLAVLIPYSLISSKLDVYMMALIPPVALLIARLLHGTDEWVRRARAANLFALALSIVLGGAGVLLATRLPLSPDLIAHARTLSWILAIAASAALLLALVRRDAMTSTLLLGLLPLAPLLYTAIVLVPVANELASTAPLVRALSSLDVPSEKIALHAAPHLWTRTMPRALERVQYVSAADDIDAKVLVTSRIHAPKLGAGLEDYEKSGEVQMIGKWFDLYMRKASASASRP